MFTIALSDAELNVTPTFNEVDEFSFSIAIDAAPVAGTSYVNPEIAAIDYAVSGTLVSATPSGFPAFALERTIAGEEFYNQGSSLQFAIAATADFSDGLQLSELAGSDPVFVFNGREIDNGRFHPALLELNSDGTGRLQNSNNVVSLDPPNEVDFGEEYITELQFEPAALTLVAPEDLNQPPIAIDDTATTNLGSPVTIDVLANDSDPEGDDLSLEIAIAPENGMATLDAGRIIYTPNEGFSGSDSFEYAIADGNNNTAMATVEVTVAAPTGQLIFGSTGNDEFLAGDPNLESGIEFLFAGAGNDEIDLGENLAVDRVYAGSGNDELFAGSGARLFGGSGDDIFDISSSEGGSRVAGQTGDDDFFLGAGDRVLGGEGDDRFFATAGGNNVLVGGAGADTFAIANAELPDAANTLADFTPGTDAIAISGLGISFEQLQRQGNAIAIQGQTVAILLGIESETLSETDFIFE